MKTHKELSRKDIDISLKTRAFLAKACTIIYIKSLHAHIQALDDALQINQVLESHASFKSIDS
ncbi:MAG: hypothetical protein ACMUJM_13590 [bacterium]